MHRRPFLQSAVAVLAQLVGNPMSPVAFAARENDGNPLLDAWTGPHGGFPRFDRVTVDAFKPAILRGMDLNRGEIAAIAGNGAAPSFQNTLEALDDAGRPLQRATQLYQIYTSAMNDKSMQAVETEVEPMLSAFHDEILHNEALFVRVKAVYAVRANANLMPEQQRLADVVYTNYAREGAALGKPEKARLKAINRAPGQPVHDLPPEPAGRRGELRADHRRRSRSRRVAREPSRGGG